MNELSWTILGIVSGIILSFITILIRFSNVNRTTKKDDEEYIREQHSHKLATDNNSREILNIHRKIEKIEDKILQHDIDIQKLKVLDDKIEKLDQISNLLAKLFRETTENSLKKDPI